MPRKGASAGIRIVDLDTHDERYITVEQFADYVKVHHTTVRRKWIDTGHLAAINLDGIWRIDVLDARLFISQHRVGPRPPYAI